jgi:hypothetical protein
MSRKILYQINSEEVSEKVFLDLKKTLIIDLKSAVSANYESQPGECIYKGEDVHFILELTNLNETKIEFPLEFIKQSGFKLKLVDPKTKKEEYLRFPPADLKLKDKFVELKNGMPFLIPSVITK